MHKPAGMQAAYSEGVFFTVFQVKKILCRSKGLYMAGAERLELATPGFGDRCSTN